MANCSKNFSNRTDEQHQQQRHQELTTNELIDQMRQVNTAVKEGKLTTVLGAQIYDICMALVRGGHGKQLEEEGHKAELNNFLASCRQAACRESGELGLPCRLKVMELLEVRLMGWRTNLSHANYYAKKERELLLLEENGKGTSSSVVSSPSLAFSPAAKNGRVETPAEMMTMQQPINKSSSNRSAGYVPSASAVPFSPFAVPPPALPLPICLPNINTAPEIPHQQPPQAGFFFIPSRAGTFIPSDFPSPQHQFPPSLFPNGPPPPPSPMFSHQQQQFHHRPLAHNSAAHRSAVLSNQPGEAVKGKVVPPQFREEVNIRNSDSGKVMGVRGRRVALIEEISKCVISFQKVDSKCRERQLTIMADTKEAVQEAKRLIGETIERNVSPERPAATDSKCGDVPSAGGEENGANCWGSQFRIGRESDGSLRIVAENPALLAAAQEALNNFLAAKIVVMPSEKSSKKCKEPTGPIRYSCEKLLAIKQNSEHDPKLIAEATKRLNGLDIFICRSAEANEMRDSSS